jgi:hypothetical protein
MAPTATHSETGAKQKEMMFMLGYATVKQQFEAAALIMRVWAHKHPANVE